MAIFPIFAAGCGNQKAATSLLEPRGRQAPRSSRRAHGPLRTRRQNSAADPHSETTHAPWFDDPFPDYDTEPVVAFSAT